MKRKYALIISVCATLCIAISFSTIGREKRNTPKSTKCGNSELTIYDSTTLSANRHGWAELPSILTGENLEYGFHDKLPSDTLLRNYSFCFDKDKRCAIWVAYPLHECYLGDISRNDKWRFDPDYIDDCYEPNVRYAYKFDPNSPSTHDRGHQLPSADRTRSQEDNMTTFYGTNVTPQLAALNRGRWKSLEDDVRKWICSDTLYVVSGTHFESGVAYNLIRDNGGNGKECPIPTGYYKVLLRTKSGNTGKSVVDCSADELHCIAFWIEHIAKPERRAISVAEAERRTGITFFPNVPNAPKNTFDTQFWQ